MKKLNTTIYMYESCTGCGGSPYISDKDYLEDLICLEHKENEKMIANFEIESEEDILDIILKSINETYSGEDIRLLIEQVFNLMEFTDNEKEYFVYKLVELQNVINYLIKRWVKI